jgi:D-3-phosphoglycerate dehydrogenase
LKIVIAEKVSPATLAILKKEPGWNVITADQITDLPAELADADALIVRSAVQADAKLLAAAPKLRIIGRAGVGVDNIDAVEATNRGIVVMNTPGANAVAVAELTLGLMISMCRSIPRANATMHAGKWDKKTLQGSELRGKTLGIVGCGRIGLEVARRAKAFGMKLIGYDPFIAPVIARENSLTLVPIDEIFSESDFLSLHVGLTPQTEGLINKHSIAIMKKGIRIVNCARGELIVDAALAEAIASGHVAGAALDVFTQEPLKDSPYFALDNVLLSPHIAGSTDEAQEAIGIQLANQVRDYLKLGVVQNAVNVASLSEEEYGEVSPYIEMADRLGKLLGHAAGSAKTGEAATTIECMDTVNGVQPSPACCRARMRSTASTQQPQPKNAASACRKTSASMYRAAPVRRCGWRCTGRAVANRATGPARLPCCTATRPGCSAMTASISKPSSPARWSSSATRTFRASSAASAPSSARRS